MNDKRKFTSDRGIRVKQYEILKKIEHEELNETKRLNRIFIRDFCLFKLENSNLCLLGLISGFGFMNENKWKDIEYKNKK